MTFPILLFLKSAVVTNEIAEKNVQWSLSANSTFKQKYMKFKWGEVLEILECKSIKKQLYIPPHFEAFCCILGKKVQSMPIIMCFVIKIHQFSNVYKYFYNHTKFNQELNSSNSFISKTFSKPWLTGSQIFLQLYSNTWFEQVGLNNATFPSSNVKYYSKIVL